MNDLARYNGRLGELFGEPNFHISLADEARDAYRRNGYFAGVRLLNSEQVGALRSAVTRLMDERFAEDSRFYEYNRNESVDPDRVLFHALGGWRVVEALHDLVFFPPLIRAAESLLGTRVRFWHDQLFVKPPHDGGVVAWHQDYSYWTRTKPIAHLTCWIALDDSTVKNGCLHYVPGSHRWPLLPRGLLSGDMESAIELLDRELSDDFRPVPIELKAGEATFHHPMMLHGSYENNSDRPRRGVVINFISDGVTSDSDEPLLHGVPLIPRGKKLEGDFFPLLSSK